MPSPASVVRSRPPPLCTHHSAAVCCCEHVEQTRGIWRGLYVERRTVGTHQVYGRTQASASLKKYFILMLYLLGNVVILKKLLRTRKIMVMHSNERGECCPRTLIDRKRKRYHNAVDVVVRLHDLTDQVPNARHLRVQHTFSSMTSLELRSSRVLRASFVSTTAW